MSQARKLHPKNFKTKVALSARRKDAPISELAVRYGVHVTDIHRWKCEAGTPWQPSFPESLRRTTQNKMFTSMNYTPK